MHDSKRSVELEKENQVMVCTDNRHKYMADLALLTLGIWAPQRITDLCFGIVCNRISLLAFIDDEAPHAQKACT